MMMITVEALQNLDPRAWTALLAQEPTLLGTSVLRVTADSLGDARNLIRYRLHLSGYREETTLIGKDTNATEARLYRDISAAVPALLPRCWFSYVNGSRGWVVMDESYNDRPKLTWQADDVESVIVALAELHATFWEQEQYLFRSGMSSLLDPVSSVGHSSQAEGRIRDGLQPLHAPLRIGLHTAQPSDLNEHARRQAGPLATKLEGAAEALRVLTGSGGWPGVVTDQHLRAAADLIDDPLPMLYPLRQLPVTLLHGDPIAGNWQLSILDEYHLLDWQNAVVGPGIVDLVAFCEQFERQDAVNRNDDWSGPRPTVTQESMEDTYILALGSLLGPRFSPRETRMAIPAARCLYTLVSWLPGLALWLSRKRSTEESDASSRQPAYGVSLPGGASEDGAFGDLVARALQRFLTSYRSL
jgi:hypothetical protein